MKPDPRIFEKNFAMPMNPGTGQEMGAVSPPERRDGLPFPKPRDFAPGASPSNPVQSTVRPREANDVPPLFTTLIRKSDGTRMVTVSEGCVTEIIPKSDAGGGGTVDGVKEWPIDNIWTGSLLTEHGPITVNQAVGIAFDVDAAGFITGNGMIEIRDVGNPQKSIHYAPKVGATAGTAGDVFVILAVLTGTGDAERLTIKHGGSNWPHYHDLPGFTKADGADVDIFDEFDRATGEYRYLGIKGMSPITAAIVGKNIEIALGNGVKNLDFTVKSYRLEARPDLEIDIYLNVAEKTIEIPVSGEHFHIFADMISGGGEAVNSRTGGIAYSTDPPINDGAHPHSFTIPAETLTTTIQVPQAPVTVANSSFYTLCWRKGLYVGTIYDGAPTPAIGDPPETLDTQTIWVLDRDSQVDFSDSANSQSLTITIL